MAGDASKDAPPAPEDDEGAASVRIFRPADWEGLRAAMSRGVGLVRTLDSLNEAYAAVQEIARNAAASLRLAAEAGALICRSALMRDESRGVHFRTDHPAAKDEWDGRHVTLRIGSM
jgi:L-aspartate oxidase